MWTVFWVLIVQTVVLFVLALYLEEVLPRSSGVRKSPFFPITAIFKKLRPSKSKHTSTNVSYKYMLRNWLCIPTLTTSFVVFPYRMTTSSKKMKIAWRKDRK